jgi:DNA-binding MarR family transcriptional regulator
MVSEETLNTIANDLFMLVLHLSTRMFNPTIMLKGLPMPPSHAKVLFRLSKLGPCPVSQLANDLIISRPNMTPIIDKLISEGYADRYDDPNDRRIIMVRLTEKAHDFLHKLEQETKKLLVDKIANLSDEDLKNLNRIVPDLIGIVMKIHV